MKIIPAVDIKKGRCVRLSQGMADQETVYSDDPIAMACHWDEEGASLIHVVDLDGAFEGRPSNTEIVKNIIYKLIILFEIVQRQFSHSYYSHFVCWYLSLYSISLQNL